MEIVFIRVAENVIESERDVFWTDHLKIVAESEDKMKIIYKFFMPDMCKNFYGNRYYLACEMAGKHEWKVLASELMSKETDLENFLDCISFMVTFRSIAVIVRSRYPMMFSENDIIEIFNAEHPKIKKQLQQGYPEMRTIENLLRFLQIERFKKIKS